MKTISLGVPLTHLSFSNEDLMRELGHLAIRRIIDRTRKGYSSRGTPFSPLSRRYAREKAKALGTARADLTVSGRMLNDMVVVRVTATGCEIGFASAGPGSRGGTFIQRSRAMGAADKAFFHEEAGRVLRPFFDLTPDDEEAIVQAAERWLDRQLAAV